MSESTPGSQKKGVAREADHSSQGNSQQMQFGILYPSTSLAGDRPSNKAPGTIEENKNIRTDSDGHKTMQRSTLYETHTQSKFTNRSSYNDKSIQPKLKYTGKGPPKVLHGNNNQQSAASVRQSGRSKHVILQGDASSYGSAFDTSAGSDKLKSNGEYEISKQGRVWCIRDLKTNKLTTLKTIKADEVFFESKELVSVDGVFHQLIVHNGKKPKLEIAERSSSSSEDERKPNACDFSYGSKSDDYSEASTTLNSLPESEEPSSRFQKQPNKTRKENAMAYMKAGARTVLFKETEAEETQGSDVNQSDERASKKQNNYRSNSDNASARPKRSLYDGDDRGQASPSYNTGTTGGSHDGSTKQPGNPRVTGTGQDAEVEETQGSGVNPSDERVSKQQNDSHSKPYDASARPKRSRVDGDGRGQASPSPVSTGDSHDGSTEQPVMPPVTGTGQESVVELQHVHHTFTETDGLILVNMYVKEVDKASLKVNFCPDTVQVKFRTRDAQFLKLCKGSTENTKFSWTIKLKGQVQEDNCWFKVNSLAVSLNISKKVFGRWGDLENLKRTGSKTNQEESHTQKIRVLPETPKIEIGYSQPRNQDTQTKDAMPGDDQGESKDSMLSFDAPVTNLQSDGENDAQSSDSETKEDSAGGGIFAQSSDPKKTKGSADGGIAAPSSDLKKTKGSADGGNDAPSSDHKTTEGSPAGGNVSSSSESMKSEGSGDGGNVKPTSDLKTTEDLGDGGNVEPTSDLKSTEGSGDGGKVETTSDLKTTEGSDDGGNVAPTSDLRSTEGSGDGGNVEPTSDLKSIEGSDDGGNVAPTSELKTTEGSGDGGNVAQSLDPKLTEVSTKLSDMKNFVEKDVKEHVNGAEASTKHSRSDLPDMRQNQSQDTTDEKDRNGLEKELKPDTHQKTKEEEGREEHPKPTSEKPSGSDGMPSSLSTNPGTTGGRTGDSTDQPDTGASEQDDVPPSLPPRNKKRKKKNANKETDSKTQGNLMEKSPKAPPRTRKLQKDEIFANSQTTNNPGTLDTGKENAGNVDEANQAKHNTPGSQTGFQYRNNTHTAEDSENRPSANIVSSDRAFKKQTVEIKHDFSQGEPNNSKVSDSDSQKHLCGKRQTNGTYTFVKDGGYWCILDAKSGALLTVLTKFQANEIYFRGKYRVFVDEEQYTIKKLGNGTVELTPVHEQTPPSKKDNSQLQAAQNSQRTTPASFQSSLKNESETTDNENNCQGPPLPVHGSTMDFHDSRTVHLAFYEVLKQKIHHAEITGDEEKETCDCTVIGHVQKVEDAMKQIHSIETTLAKNVISFDDIKNCKVDAESLNLHAYFEYQNTAGTDTYFYLNSARRKLYIVSENQQKADKATNSVKNVIVKQVLTNTEESHTEEETRFEDNVCVISMPGGTTNFIGAKADVERCISKRTTRTKTIEIQSDESFRLLCNFGVQNMIDSDKVSIVEITSNNKHGFVLKSTSEDNLKTGEIIIRAFEKSICLQVVCMSQDQFQKEDWTDISKQLCDKHSVVANIENVEKVCNGEGNHLAEKLCTFLNWKLSDYVTLKLSNRDPKEAWESILLYPVPEEYFAEENTKAGHSKQRFKITIGNKGVFKSFHNFDESLKKGLGEVRMRSHVCIPVGDHKQFENLSNLVKRIVYNIKECFVKIRTEALVIELCIADRSMFQQCQSTVEDYLKTPGECTLLKHLCICQPPVRCRIVKGKVHEQEVHVIVNSTSSDLQLNHGYISMNILETAGKEIQDELDKKYKKHIAEWDIAVTEGYNLPCMKVFHGAPSRLSKSTANKTFEKLEQFVYNCLKTAEYLGFKSIAFPAFGTGKQLKYPKNDVAMAMTKAISDFCVRFAVCCLEEIRLVLNESDDDLIHEFETSLSKRVNILDGKKHTEISVIGKSEDVRCALQSMQEIVQAKFSARSMTHDEPVVPTIERDGDDGENEKQQGRLEDEPSVQLYVVIKGIKMNTAKQDLEKLLKTKRSPKTLIYQMGQTEAVVKCASAEDARQLLLQQKDNSNLRFEKVPPQPLVKKKITLNCESFKAIKDCLEKVPIDYNEMNKEYVISTPTEYEFKIVYSLLKDYKKRIRAESNTVHVEKIEAVSEQMYDILKNKLFTEIEGKWSHSFTPENESLLLEFENSMTATEHSKKFNSFFEKHKDDTFMDVECDKSQIGTEQWCKEIEQSNNGDDCCVFVPDKDKVIVFSSSFDECMNIKNALFVKQGKRQVKQTGRARRHVSPDQKPAKTEDPHLHQTSANQNDAKSMSFMTNEGISVKIYTASICNLDVDCIVNAANENLDHGGGVAAAILKAAGKAINSEGKSYIRTHGPIPVGQVCWTSAGNLKNDLIIHAVGPRWYNYDTSFWHGVEKCANDLKAALLNSFDAADRHKYATIALPAISSAIFGVPEDLCVMQYGKAVIGYSAKSRGTGLKEIHFVDINEGMTTRIRNMFYRMLTQNEKHPYTYESFVIASGRGRRRNEKSDSQYKKDESMFFPHSQGDTKSSSFSASLGKKPILQTIHISNTVTLEVQKVNDIGDISNVEALIVPVNPSGLNEIADEVERSIPQEYQISFLEKKTSGIRTHSRSGESFVLHGYSSGFKYLIFVVMPEGCMDGISLQQMFSEIFELCKGRSIRSLATFLLGFDKDENTIANMDVTAEDGVTMMVQALMDSLKEFSKEGQALQTVLLCKTPKMYEAISLSMALGQDDKKSGKGTEVKSEDSGPSTYVDETNDCVICMDTISLPKTLICGHVFCTECIDQCFKIGKVVCPTCFRVVGKITGDQPSGTMTVYSSAYNDCAGYHGQGKITITYNFPDGLQESNHPSPGQPYRGIRRTAYFPNNDEGRTVCRMLKVAFRRKLVFTIGRSRTTGHDGVITWNDIHHKTDPLPGKQFGYPDPSYLTRVTEELAAKGITEKDIDSRQPIDGKINI
ncbi:uncharacterized protein LOC128211426 isoform X3 [Mya arenaria]|uniref:uncharacterized protein LOC128211426 isoform X3 n=1 Tax=Mya arenaria TaxID=6604 RepID=UPI0022E13589|nr:uncharacterized protein LOC128211426 isoform X3 [Mya arenaria]